MINPWKTNSSKEIYQNPWIRLREDQVTRPDGHPGIYSVVEAKGAATGVVALDKDNNVYLVGQYRYALDEYSWEIIEGGSEKGESPLEAIKRELVEEAGLTAKSWKQLGGEVHVSNCFSNEKGYLFIARDLEECERAPDGTEMLEVKKVPFEDVYQMVLRGEIKDSMTVMGVLLARAFGEV